ncbi:isopentenyl-diphosphate Delta-isomerase [Curtobacterium sp. VKM Ac-2865]|jgi:isopentenyl-diphosphate delta-isomerase|uniref:isopentenyl-diphosphate Delta-isomerase n=1 Tax=Curtobacterium sp. VKM Ac-2865 TaxID=2783817 RepID=UPI001889CC65|nr:isopentenyl-diphosphate Delta-isomerase [Curtobacterium sp. VKM Ac-2865]MBF4583736.1 isopentenyl-diphosphate Delta-isomerase [Curtobacterium sp. VKM Ac-2865]
MNHFPETVVLLAEDRTPIGTADKFAVHTDHTPLHLAFSCHVTNADGDLLVTRRALSKKAWPGVWTNSFCGHPGPDETFEDAIARRAARELGITVRDVQSVLPDFRYRAVDASGIVENEVCPVFRAVTDDVPAPADDEVSEYEWLSEAALRSAVSAAPFAFSPWLGWQLEQLPVNALD